MSAIVTPTPRWIVSPRFDLSLFFGGAAVSVLFLLVFSLGAPIVMLWWVWLLALDGPHIGAAFTRTYLDPLEWRSRTRVLVFGLLTFVIGPLFWLAGIAMGSDDPFLLFLALATFYGYYHVVRQHYGFVALYDAVDPARDRGSRTLDRWTIYLGCWLPYVYFILSHPRARALLRLPANADVPPAETALVRSLAGVWIATLVWYAVSHAKRGGRPLLTPKVAYVLVTLLVYGAIYFFVARLEPVYAASTGPDQDFLLLSIAIVAFHNVQYLGLVWFHNRNRYKESGGHGAAQWVNRSPVRYLAVCAVFSLAVYAFSACSTGVFPLCDLVGSSSFSSFNGATWHRLGLCLWWGLALNHYYLDQKIWRIRGDEMLRRNLRLA